MTGDEGSVYRRKDGRLRDNALEEVKAPKQERKEKHVLHPTSYGDC